MVRPIVHDALLLSRPSQPAGPEDLGVGQDLLDTLQAHAAECVGMAANMIGVCKRIIVYDAGDGPVLLFNPKILRRSDPYETQESCLSLAGSRPARRWQTIVLSAQDAAFHRRTITLQGFAAQIVQHELDHCDGVLI